MQKMVVTSLSAGLSQKGVRNHNERLLLTLLQRHGEAPGSDLARMAGLSPPAVSSILKRLEQDGLITRGDPVRGKVGKPSMPMRLSPGGALAFGLKIGRRSADLLLLDFTGHVRAERTLKYAFPIPAEVFGFLADGLAEITAALSPAEPARLCGIGVAAPFEMWNWQDPVAAAPAAFLSWKDIDVPARIAAFTDLPVLIINDATAACHAEQIYGRGKSFRDYAYFFVGAFVGGGVVLNSSVFEGRQGNAGALGSLRTTGAQGEVRQLVDRASIHLLEDRVRRAGGDVRAVWDLPQDWSSIAEHVTPWLEQTARELARASLSTCAVIDFEAILIDGAFPPGIRERLVTAVREAICDEDTRGVLPPRIEPGSIGPNARAIGAACGPIRAQFMLNTHDGLAVG